MPQRSLSGPLIADMKANQIDWAFFVRFDFGGVTGTLRYTDHPCTPADTISLNLNTDDELVSHVWTETALEVPAIEQNMAGILSVSFLSINNLDSGFSTLAQVPGLRNVAIKIFVAWFAANGTLDGAYVAYSGRTDDSTHKAMSQITLKTPTTGWATRGLGQEIGALCPYIYRDIETCAYGIDHLTLLTAGTGYTSNPTVTISAPDMVGGVQATATAIEVSGGVTTLTLTNKGSGYSVPATVTFTLGGGVTQATASASLEPIGQTTCDHTRGNGCNPRANQARFGGDDLLPKPGTTLYFGGLAHSV